MIGWLPYIAVALDAALSLAAILAGGSDRLHYFREGQAMTWLNSFQLLITGALGLKIYTTRARAQPGRPIDAHFWFLTALGSGYLALDEVLQFHESDGPVIKPLRRSLGQPAAALVVGGMRLLSVGNFMQLGYGMLVLLVCWRYRRELLRDRRALAFFVAGAIQLVVSEWIDFSKLGWQQAGLDLTGLLWPWWSTMEETTKVTGFGTILGGFIQRLASAEAAPAEQPAARCAAAAP